MKGTSQLLVAIRLFSTIHKFAANLTLYSDSGRVRLLILEDQILFVEIGDLFPASWLAQIGKTDLASKVRTAASGQERIDAFRDIAEKPELKRLFVETTKKHLTEFFSATLGKCELKAEHLPVSAPLFTISEMLSDCAGKMISVFPSMELIPANEISFQLSADYLERSTRLKISLQQGYLISRLERPQTVHQILATIPAEEEATKRNILILWAYGILDSTFLGQMLPKLDASKPQGSGESSRAKVFDSGISGDMRKQVQVIEQTYASLSSKDYYTLLGVTTKADLSQIKTAYYKLARKFHPDRYYGLEDPVLKEKIDIIFSTINVAYETLKNTKARHQYDAAPVEDRRISTAAVVQEPNRPPRETAIKVAEDYYQRAQKSYSSRNFFEAVQFLRSATQIAPDVPKYWRQLGIVLTKNEQWRKEAEDSFNRAIDLEPLNAENHLYLAFLYRNSALKLRARRCFAKVLELDPKNDVAAAQIAEIDTEESGQKKRIRDTFFKKK
jgi:curved DNA-binding protein CbpA